MYGRKTARRTARRTSTAPRKTRSYGTKRSTLPTKKQFLSSRPTAAFSPSYERRLGFPATKTVPMRYTSEVTFSPTPLGAYVFRANGVYDPDFTSTGNQPYSYDQWSLFYPTWVVVGSKLSVKIFPGDTNAVGVPLMYGVYRSNGSSLPIAWTAQTLIEAGSAYDVVSSWAGAENSSPGLTATYSPRKWFGIDKIVDNDHLWGQTGSDPSLQTFYIVWAAPGDSFSTLSSVRGIVTIDYLVKFMNPNNMQPS